jgi:hypothetical protein
VNALDDESGAVRSEARASLLTILRRPADSDIIARLDVLAATATQAGRVEAVRCLVALVDRSRISVVLPYAEAGAPEAVRAAALEGLAPLADETARDAIVAAIADPDAHVREVACAAAADLPTLLARPAIPALIERLKDTTAIARAAHDTLERATGVSLPESYTVWREWWACEASASEDPRK